MSMSKVPQVVLVKVLQTYGQDTYWLLWGVVLNMPICEDTLGRTGHNRENTFVM